LVIWASGEGGRLVFGFGGGMGWDGCVGGVPLGRRGSFLCGGFETRLVGLVGGMVFGVIFRLFRGCLRDRDVDVLRWLWSCDRNEDIGM
jgi:hypothetical protein